MRVWFKCIATMLGIEDASERGVREILEAAAARMAVVGLSFDDIDACPDPDCCVIEAVDGDALILVPTGGESRRDIVPGARFHIAIASSRGFHRGETTILSRFTEQDKHGSGRRIGFRASLPPTLAHFQRRGAHRVPVAFDLAPKADLFQPSVESPLCTATILDLSEAGIRVRVASEHPFEIGQAVAIDARFPSAIPSFRSETEVVRVGSSKVPGSQTLGLRLIDPPIELARSIRTLDVRRGNRPAA